MVDDRRYTEERRRASEVLQVPEEEGEHQTDGEPHEPRDEDDGPVRNRPEYLHHLHPFGDRAFLSRLSPRYEGARAFGYSGGGDVADCVVRGGAQGDPDLLVASVVRERDAGVGGVDFPHRVVPALLARVAGLLEHELSRCDEGTRHQHGEDGEADGVVAFDALLVAARVVTEHVGVVQGDADEEHCDGPAERAEHPLAAVVLEVVTEVPERGGVGEHEGGRAEELADDDDEKKEQQEGLVDVRLFIDDATEGRTDEADDFRSGAVGDVLVIERQRRLAELRDLRVRKDCVERRILHFVDDDVAARRRVTRRRSNEPRSR